MILAEGSADIASFSWINALLLYSRGKLRAPPSFPKLRFRASHWPSTRAPTYLYNQSAIFDQRIPMTSHSGSSFNSGKTENLLQVLHFFQFLISSFLSEKTFLDFALRKKGGKTQYRAKVIRKICYITVKFDEKTEYADRETFEELCKS